jgi:hypothetical protein
VHAALTNGARKHGARKRFFLGVAAFTLIRATQALAADSSTVSTLHPNSNEAHPPAALSAPLHAPLHAQPFTSQSFGGSLGAGLSDPAFAAAHDEHFGLPAALTLPRDYSLPPAAESHAFSSTDFRPRGHSIFDTDPSIANANDRLMVDKTVWQQLQEYRTRDRVRVMTLWESAASNVSIQTNRKGDPSLQWTSRLMNRGGATRGLLDRWSPVQVIRSFSHPGGSGVGKPASALVQPHPGMSAIP